jgi:cell wall-associated NlpC family hydrolase
MRLVLQSFRFFLTATLVCGLIPGAINHAAAAPTLIEVQARVIDLQEQAAAAAENAQEAKVQLAILQKTLNSVQSQASVQSANVEAMKKTVGAIAAEQYKTGGISESLNLLFSANPTLYLSSAGALEIINRQRTENLKKFSTASQRLTATSLTVSDKLALVRAAQARYTTQLANANAKLKEAEALLEQLTKEERDKLNRIFNDAEDADQQRSLGEASKYSTVSGKAGVAIRFALNQIGDKYVFGAAGMVYWDCSGLTMRAYEAAGISLPHSSAMQYKYGKPVDRQDLQPGDLVFWGKPISHVAMYLGGGRMVTAPRTGARVKIDNFPMNLGKKPYIGARRL